MTQLLILFAKAPEPGKVKTRLTPFLSEVEAANLQKAFILDLLELTRTAAKTNKAERVIACAPPNHSFFTSLQKKDAVRCIAQEGRDLGERMKNAFQWGFERGFRKIVIIGCDSPTLPAPYLEQAFEALASADVVVGPGLDGGYYLIGARALFPDLFTGLCWGTETVLTKTLDKIRANDISSQLLPFWYDIDRPGDLSLLKSHLVYLRKQKASLPKATAALLLENPPYSPSNP